MKRLAAAMALVVGLAGPAYATDVYLTGVTITRVYVQSQDGSTAHLVQINKDIVVDGRQPCYANRVHVDLEDRALLAAAIDRQQTRHLVDMFVTVDAPPKAAAGHDLMNTCKLKSLY